MTRIHIYEKETANYFTNFKNDKKMTKYFDI